MKKLLCIALLALGACSVVKASNQEEAKDLSVLKLYNSRVQIIGELGAPSASEVTPQGLQSDTFSVVNGYSAASRSARAAGHAVADVATLGLWELAGNPIEGGFNGSRVNGQAIYNSKGQAIKLEFYEDGKVLVNQTAPEYNEYISGIMPQSAPVAPAVAPVAVAPAAPINAGTPPQQLPVVAK